MRFQDKRLVAHVVELGSSLARTWSMVCPTGSTRHFLFSARGQEPVVPDKTMCYEPTNNLTKRPAGDWSVVSGSSMVNVGSELTLGQDSSVARAGARLLTTQEAHNFDLEVNDSKTWRLQSRGNRSNLQIAATWPPTNRSSGTGLVAQL